MYVKYGYAKCGSIKDANFDEIVLDILVIEW